MRTGNLRRMAIYGAALMAAAWSVGPAEAQDAADGKKLYMTMTCIACHGKDGAKSIQDYPNIAGQDAEYAAAQIKDVIDGKRVGAMDKTNNPRTAGMKGALLTPEGKRRITDEQIKVLTAWLSKLPPAAPKTEGVDAAKVEKGAAAYKKFNCKNCHGDNGLKPIKAHPYVGGQKKEYLFLQMKDLRDGVRKNGKSATMRSFIQKATDDDLAAMAEFLSQAKK